MEFEILFLGTSGAVPTPERGLSATLLKRGGDRVLVDCGEGTQRQLMRAGVGFNQIHDVLLTHLHADHFLGLPGMLKTWQLWGRQEAVRVYGPRGLSGMVPMFKRIVGHTDFAIHYEELPPDATLERQGYRLKTIQTDHRVTSLGYALEEEARPGRFDVETAKALGVQPGPDFGRLQRGEAVMGSNGLIQPEQVLGEGRASRKVVVTGDTRPCAPVLQAAFEADVLIHDSTFTLEAQARAEETYHSTSTEAAQLAKLAKVKLLALTHLSFRHSPKELLDEAKAIYARVVIPSDLDKIDVPFAERGEPVHFDRKTLRQMAKDKLNAERER